MRYLRIQWLHDHPDEPVELFSELDEAGWEVRKVEVFRDGSLGFASRTEATPSTVLGEAPVPALADITADAQFRPLPLSKEEFESVWARRLLPKGTP